MRWDWAKMNSDSWEDLISLIWLIGSRMYLTSHEMRTLHQWLLVFLQGIEQGGIRVAAGRPGRF